MKDVAILFFCPNSNIDYQFFFKKNIGIYYFLHGDIRQGKVTS